MDILAFFIILTVLYSVFDADFLFALIFAFVLSSIFNLGFEKEEIKNNTTKEIVKQKPEINKVIIQPKEINKTLVTEYKSVTADSSQESVNYMGGTGY